MIIVDIGDLYRYGDQFTNLTIDGAINGVALPGAGLQKQYVSDAMRDALWMDATKDYIAQDGVIDFTIKGPPQTTVDHT